MRLAGRSAHSFRIVVCALALASGAGRLAAEPWRQWNGPEPPVSTGLTELGGVWIMGASEADAGTTYRSTDQGLSWIRTSFDHGGTTFLQAGGNAVYQGVYLGGLHRSHDLGQTWEEVAPEHFFFSDATAMVEIGSLILVGRRGGDLIRSTDAGETWAPLEAGPEMDCTALYAAGSTFLAGGSREGLWRTTNDGATWTQVIGGPGSQIHVGGIAVSGGSLVAGVFDFANVLPRGLHRSTDGGATWTFVPSNLDPWPLRSLVSWNNTLFATTDFTEQKVRSTDGGTTWVALQGVPAEAEVQTFEVVSGIPALGSTLGVYVSTDGGANWQERNSGTVAIRAAHDFLAEPGGLFAVVGAAGSTAGDIWFTSDRGASWERRSAGIGDRPLVTDLLRAGDALFAAQYGFPRGIYRSSDDGSSWGPSSTGIPTNTVPQTLFAHEGVLFYGAHEALYRSTDGGTNWVVQPAMPRVNALAEHGGRIFAGRYSLGVAVSDDGGLNWSDASQGLPPELGRYINDLLVHAGGLYAATQGHGVFRWNGSTWIASGVAGGFVVDLESVDGVLLASSALEGILLSMDDGATWSDFSEGLGGWGTSTIGATAEDLLAGPYGAGVWSRPRTDLPVPAAVGGAQHEPGPRLAIFPNPAAPGERLQLQGMDAGAGPLVLTLHDAMGRRIWKGIDVGEIDTRGLPSGAYWIRAELERTAGARFVVVR